PALPCSHLVEARVSSAGLEQLLRLCGNIARVLIGLWRMLWDKVSRRRRRVKVGSPQTQARNSRMTFRTQLEWTCVVIVACACACSSGKSVTKSDLQTASYSGWAQLHTKAQGNEKLTEYDTNHDGKTDVWQYTVKAKSPDGKEYNRLVRKELDLNGDGRVDIVRYYGEDGQ